MFQISHYQAWCQPGFVYLIYRFQPLSHFTGSRWAHGWIKSCNPVVQLDGQGAKKVVRYCRQYRVQLIRLLACRNVMSEPKAGMIFDYPQQLLLIGSLMKPVGISPCDQSQQHPAGQYIPLLKLFQTMQHQMLNVPLAGLSVTARQRLLAAGELLCQTLTHNQRFLAF
ncbi:hypothetical protein CBP31_06300 [Oceanisphaera profunda]|uniref:Uncharacterized protein n=1 Tax=Oceanisphaera profunda TaxID=1416627 RepID=A0A1Y0D5C2_9GAMM|nr:hypothetical protein CBP31_06300 [Oceanisphaera profunda]